MKKLVSVFVAIAVILTACVSSFADEIITYDAPDISNSKMALLYEESTDTYLYLKKPDEKNCPASMTKVMTALLVLEHDPELTGNTVVSDKAVSYVYCNWMNDEHLLAGEECSVKDLMYYLLILSANEAGTALAEYVAGSIPEFVKMMNARADELGMTDTRYADPHGLSPLNKITCRDMLTLCRTAMQNETFRKIVCTKQGEMPVSNRRDTPLRYASRNGLMFPGDYPEYETGFEQDISGIKTGYTVEAGNTFSCSMKHDDMTFYTVVMNGHDFKNSKGIWVEAQFSETADLMRYARSFKKVGYKVGEECVSIPSGFGSGSGIMAAAAEDVYILSQNDQFEAKTELTRKKGIKKGDIVGTVTLTDDFGNARTADLIACADVEAPWPYYATAALASVLALILAVRAKKHS